MAGGAPRSSSQHRRRGRPSNGLRTDFSALVEAFYDASVEPAGWPHAMQLLTRRFVSPMHGLYFLSTETRSANLLHVDGFDAPYLRSFADHFFTPDNPCLRSEPLHRPGVVRTDERLVRYFKDPSVLTRSRYYNEWMRPQHAEYTMGTTVIADRTAVGNITLLRSRPSGPYRADEVAAFAKLCAHLRRSLDIGLRLDTIATRATATRETLDHLPDGVALVDSLGRLLHANRAAERLLREGTAVTLRNGRITGARDSTLGALLRRVGAGPPREGGRDVRQLAIERPDTSRPLHVSAIRLSAHSELAEADRPIVMLLMTDRAPAAAPGADALRRTYGLTPAETRLAMALLDGHGVRRAAEAARMTYETARWYVKILLQKTQTTRQAELVAHLFRSSTGSVRDLPG